MKLWPTPSPVDPHVAILLEQNQRLVGQNIALVERIGKLVAQLARSEPVKQGAEPALRTVFGRPNYSPEYWRSDEAAEVENDGVVQPDLDDPEAAAAAEQALKESFRESLRSAR